MAPRTWETREQPILEAIATGEAGSDEFEFDHLIEALPDLSRRELEVGVQALLDGQFINGVDSSSLAGFDIGSLSLRERGRRAVGQWPSDDVFDSFIQLLDARLSDDSLDADTRTKLQRLRATIAEIGKSVTGGVLAAYIQQVLGIR